jgi:hypothetical protein
MVFSQDTTENSPPEDPSRETHNRNWRQANGCNLCQQLSPLRSSHGAPEAELDIIGLGRVPGFTPKSSLREPRLPLASATRHRQKPHHARACCAPAPLQPKTASAPRRRKCSSGAEGTASGEAAPAPGGQAPRSALQWRTRNFSAPTRRVRKGYRHRRWGAHRGPRVTNGRVRGLQAGVTRSESSTLAAPG